MKFADGSYENNITFNSSGDILSGTFKNPEIDGIQVPIMWYTDKECTQKVEIGENGMPNIQLKEDINLYVKMKTIEIKGYSGDKSKMYNEFKKISGNSR